MTKITLSRVNGVGKVNGVVPRKVLERNVLDMLEGNPDLGDLSFDDALYVAENATYETLVDILAYRVTVETIDRILDGVE